MSCLLEALLFDCDGVLSDTERDGHRIAYNEAFAALGIDAHWDVEEYEVLVQISGGKERMRFFFTADPENYPLSRFDDQLIKQLYDKKTEIFKSMASAGRLPCRPGVMRLIKEAHQRGVELFMCSTAHRDSVAAIIRSNMGDEYLGYFTDLLCGDIVTKKKPEPDIYLFALNQYNLDKDRCIVVEDSRNGLLAATNAGIRCIVTPSYYTENEDFSEADLVVSNLGEADNPTRFIKGPEILRNITQVNVDCLNKLLYENMVLS
jgi:haloacid dehalogenase superfamily, subfamily IA, variant 3 with third motif having DD or ED